MDPARRVYVAFELKTKAGHADMKNVKTLWRQKYFHKGGRFATI